MKRGTARSPSLIGSQDHPSETPASRLRLHAAVRSASHRSFTATNKTNVRIYAWTRQSKRLAAHLPSTPTFAVPGCSAYFQAAHTLAILPHLFEAQMAYTDYGCHERHGCRVQGRLFHEDDHKFGVEAQFRSDPWTYIACPHEFDYDQDCDEDKVTAHRDSIIISVDGACRGNGGPYARSGIGVFLHRDSQHNYASLVNTPHIHTSQRAELYAGLQGLEVAKWIKNVNPRKGDRDIGPPGPCRKLRRVVIKADSKYLVSAMTEWIHKWEDNG